MRDKEHHEACCRVQHLHLSADTWRHAGQRKGCAFQTFLCGMLVRPVPYCVGARQRPGVLQSSSHTMTSTLSACKQHLGGLSLIICVFPEEMRPWPRGMQEQEKACQTECCVEQ